jgi:hypothetical protein
MTSMFRQMFLVGLIFGLSILLIIFCTIFYFVSSKPEKIEPVRTTEVVYTNKKFVDTPKLIINPIESVKVFDTVKVYVYPKPVEVKIEEPKLPPPPTILDTINLN